jgi:hypothetical protein
VKIVLDSDAGRRTIETAVTNTLDDLAGMIREVYNLTDSPYLFDFGGTVYAHRGDMDAGVYQCDLFLYTDEPAAFRSGGVTVRVSHENISDSIYDYCDFEHPHYCPVFEEIIDVDSCYTSMMCLNGFFAVESSEGLLKIGDMDTAREKCSRCIYTNCDGIHHEMTVKHLSLEDIEPSRAAYRVRLAEAPPGEIDAVRAAFLTRLSKSDDAEE